MKLTRRGFLIGAVPAATGVALAIEELLRPSPRIFLPPRDGWVARDLRQLWLDYCEPLRPVGVLLQAEFAPPSTMAMWHTGLPVGAQREAGYLIEAGMGVVKLVLPEDLSPALERRMRSMLSKPAPLPFELHEHIDHLGGVDGRYVAQRRMIEMPCHATAADLMPWINAYAFPPDGHGVNRLVANPHQVSIRCPPDDPAQE